MRYVVGGTPALNELGGELLVCDAAGQTVHRLTGEARIRFERVVAGDLVELPHDDVTAALEAAGLIVAVGDPTVNVVGMSRRRALAIGAAAAAAGVVTVALPKAAAAQSPGPAPGPDYPDAPAEGTAALEDATFGSSYFNAGSPTTVRYTNVTWANPDDTAVTFNYRLYTPSNSSTPYVSGGPVDGFIPENFSLALGQFRGVEVTGVVVPQTYLWRLTAFGGTTLDIPGTFET